jgi:tetratricopeptide (TPR) repeat protein
MIYKAKELDPLSSVIGVNISEILQTQGDYKASAEYSLKLIDLDPDFPAAHRTLGLSYLKLGRKAEGIAALEKEADLRERSGLSLGPLGYAYAVTGRRTEAIAVAKELEDKFAKNEASGRDVAAVYAGLGDKDKAFEWMEKTFQRRGDLGFTRWEIPWESLRDDPRYKDLLKRIGLPD